MKHILITGAFRFPDKDAAAKRVLGLGHLFRDLGYQVTFAGGERGFPQKKNFLDFSYYSQNELDKGNNRNIIQKIWDFYRSGNRTVNWLINFHKNTPVEVVVIYNSSYIFQWRVHKFCKSKGIKIIGDCTEWYESHHLPGGAYGLVSLDNYLKMHYGFIKLKNVITISKYLDKYYRKKKCNTVIIPPQFIEPQILSGSSVEKGNVKRLIYAGSPGRKDDLEIIIDVLSKSYFQFKISLHIIGISLEEFKKSSDIEISGNVKFIGRIPYENVKEYYMNADFSIIIRPNKRFANAGFPTKFVESLSFGVPVIATNTSDIPDYLRDGFNGFLLKDDKKRTVEEALKAVVVLEPSRVKEMKENALKTSTKFHYSEAKGSMKEFLYKVTSI